MKSIAILKVGRDYGVVFLDLRIAGLKSRGERLEKPLDQLEAIHKDLLEIMPTLREMYYLDVALEDTASRKYIARLYTHGGVVYYVVLASPKNSLRSVLRHLKQQGWELLVRIEKKSLRKVSETDFQ
ncbi:MAG: hypothetical protein QXU58_03735 [Pyrobaculum sp.]